jgi:hypothetical protein
MQTVTKREVREVLNEMLNILQEGRMTEGQEVYFADEVVTQEGNNPALTGKQAAIERLNNFRESIGVAEFISYKIGDVAVDRNTSFYDAVLSLKLNNGETISLEQVVKTVWNDEGKIVFERYFHS